MLGTIQKYITTYRNHPLLAQLRDVRALGLMVFAVIVLLVSWSGVQAIQANYKLEQQVAKLRQENDLQELQNSNQKLKNQYYGTPQYLELAARQNFGLAMPGEKELIVPKDVAMARVKDVKPATTEATQQTAVTQDKDQPFYGRNVKAWMDFFLHRSSTTTQAQ